MSGPGVPRDDEEVVVVDYDPAWPRLFAVEAALLDSAVGDWITGGDPPRG